MAQADYILSIVPPRDALATAQRITTALQATQRGRSLYYVDLNAISPGLARKIADEFRRDAPDVKFVDGGIVGGPPRPGPDDRELNSSASAAAGPGASWTRPAIPLSGPHPLPSAHLAQLLNSSYLGPEIGSASGLKCCFASLTKGLSALAIQSFSTAHSLGVFSELQHLLEQFQPAIHRSTTRAVTAVPPKSGRWVEEMVQIGRCFGEEGGWDNVSGTEGADVYQRVAGVYKAVAEDTVLGKERQEHRVRGTTADDVAVAVDEALKGGPEKP